MIPRNRWIVVMLTGACMNLAWWLSPPADAPPAKSASAATQPGPGAAHQRALRGMPRTYDPALGRHFIQLPHGCGHTAQNTAST